MSLVSVLCKVEVSASGLSLVRRSPIEYGMSIIEKPQKQGLGPIVSCRDIRKVYNFRFITPDFFHRPLY